MAGQVVPDHEENSFTQMSITRANCAVGEQDVCDVGKSTRCIKFLIFISSLVNSPRYRTVIGPEAVPKGHDAERERRIKTTCAPPRPALLCTTTEMKRKGFQQLGLSDDIDVDIGLLVEDHQGDNGSQDERKGRAQLLAVIGVD